MGHRELFQAKDLPVLQNRVFPTAAEARNSPTGDIVLVQDLETGLVFNRAFEPEKLVYDENYQNEQACSLVFQKHLEDVSDIIGRYLQDQSLIEVGCGKGYFLEHLDAKGYQILGVDPAYEGDNDKVIKAHFGPELGLSADGILLRHVLEHIPDPVSFLSLIANANGGKGTIYIEIPCFDWICQHRSWFDIFYEHVNYFRLDDFDRIFGRVLESGHIFGGQYLYIVADLSSLQQPQIDPTKYIDFPDDFMSSLKRNVALAKDSERNAIWGGSSKGVIFSIYMERAGVQIDFAIDINPAKQGKYLAKSGLPVLAPDVAESRLQTSDNMFVMNSNYFDEIVQQSSNQYRYYKVDHE